MGGKLKGLWALCIWGLGFRFWGLGRFGVRGAYKADIRAAKIRGLH